MKKGAYESFPENEQDTKPREYAPPELAATSHIPKVDLEEMLSRESGTHTKDAINRHLRERLSQLPEDAFTKPTRTQFKPQPLPVAVVPAPVPVPVPVSAVVSAPASVPIDIPIEEDELERGPRQLTVSYRAVFLFLTVFLLIAGAVGFGLGVTVTKRGAFDSARRLR